jgi:hypothetical protein
LLQARTAVKQRLHLAPGRHEAGLESLQEVAVAPRIAGFARSTSRLSPSTDSGFATISTMSRRLTWLLTVPLMTGGLLAGHSVAYRVAIRDPHEREHALEATGHGYLAYVPLFAGVCLALVLGAVVLRALAAFRRQSGSATPATAFAMLPVLAFVLQEHVERAVHSGTVPWTAALELTFAVGLAVQLPFAFAALLLAEVLDSLAQAVGVALAAAGPPQSKLPLPAALVLVPADLRRMPILARGYGGRAPPRPLVR